jgi:hypothetical protein
MGKYNEFRWLNDGITFAIKLQTNNKGEVCL